MTTDDPSLCPVRGRYVLDENGNPIPEPDFVRWAIGCFGSPQRFIASDQIGDVMVSTVFLGLDHNFGDGLPLLFETMIFGGAHDEYQARFATRKEALAGHAAAVALVRATVKSE